ncbi:hypothetical protein ACFLT7_01965 [candidate division KSB1 bacterium]
MIIRFNLPTRWLPALLIPAWLCLTIGGCSDREIVVDEQGAEVVFVGEPQMIKAEPGIHIIENSFGGSELIYVPQSEKFDQAVLDTLIAEAERNPMATKHANYRFGFYIYRGLVKNEGNRRADLVTVKLKHRFENYDSTYVRGDIIVLPTTGEVSLASLYPNRLATYEIHSIHDFIDWQKILWRELDTPEEQ